MFYDYFEEDFIQEERGILERYISIKDIGGLEQIEKLSNGTLIIRMIGDGIEFQIPSHTRRRFSYRTFDKTDVEIDLKINEILLDIYKIVKDEDLFREIENIIEEIESIRRIEPDVLSEKERDLFNAYNMSNELRDNDFNKGFEWLLNYKDMHKLLIKHGIELINIVEMDLLDEFIYEAHREDAERRKEEYSTKEKEVLKDVYEEDLTDDSYEILSEVVSHIIRL